MAPSSFPTPKRRRNAFGDGILEITRAAELRFQFHERTIMIKRICSGLVCMRNMKLIAIVSMFLMFFFSAGYGAETSSANRPAHWAIPMQMEGVPNLHKVSNTLYRSAQPSAPGMKKLKAMGIETVINLRSFHSDRDEIGDTALAHESIPMKAWHAEEEDAVKFLQIATNPKGSPVLVHCQHGADRTGVMCAVYRVAVQGWSKEEALKEMMQGGFGFHGIWENLVQWIDGLDFERIKKRAEIK